MESTRSPSRIMGATLLIAGCCIGAGMLGLPLISLSTGFVPTAFMFCVSWLFMALTGLLGLEVSLRLKPGSNLMTMAEVSLGKWAKYLVAILFSFLFYCLLVAYVSGTGSLLSEAMEGILGFPFSDSLASILAAIIFGFAIYVGTGNVDQLNRFLMLGLGLAYLLLLALGIPKVSISNLRSSNWLTAVPVLPTMIVSFGYHNLIPSLRAYLNGDVKGLRFAIFFGSFIPLCIYLLWEFVFLGIVPNTDVMRQAVEKGAMVTDLLKHATANPQILFTMQLFAFFAIATSFLTVAMSFVDFTIDGLKLSKESKDRTIACVLVLLPPLLFALFYPHIFLTALNFAGAFGAVVLFGLLPVVMVWKGRYMDQIENTPQVRGGKPVLVLLALFALFVFFMQLKFELYG